MMSREKKKKKKKKLRERKSYHLERCKCARGSVLLIYTPRGYTLAREESNAETREREREIDPDIILHTTLTTRTRVCLLSAHVYTFEQ